MNKAFIAQGCLLLSLVSCGGSSKGGGSSSDSVEGEAITGQFIDAPVKGLNIVRTISGAGVTGEQGKFDCKTGEGVTFKLRNIVLGTAACGEKIYLDDIAEGDKRNNIAAILQNLSKTAASSGLIDLSVIPANQSFTFNLASANASAVLSEIVTARSSVEAAAGTTLTAQVSIADAITHANSNLPAPASDLAAVLTTYVTNGPTVVFTETTRNKECIPFITAAIDVNKIGNGYVAGFKGGSVFASKTAPVYECNEAPTENANCYEMDDDFADSFRVVNNGLITLSSKYQTTYTAKKNAQNEGFIEYEDKDLITGETKTGTETFDSAEDAFENIKGYFPFTVTESNTMSYKFSATGSILGQLVIRGTSVSIPEYRSATDYVLTKTDFTCNYAITKKPN